MYISGVGDCFCVVMLYCCILLGRCDSVWFMWFCMCMVVVLGLMFCRNVMMICRLLFDLVIDFMYMMFLMLLIVFFSGLVIDLVIFFGFVLGYVVCMMMFGGMIFGYLLVGSIGIEIRLSVKMMIDSMIVKIGWLMKKWEKFIVLFLLLCGRCVGIGECLCGVVCVGVCG